MHHDHTLLSISFSTRNSKNLDLGKTGSPVILLSQIDLTLSCYKSQGIIFDSFVKFGYDWTSIRSINVHEVYNSGPFSRNRYFVESEGQFFLCHVVHTLFWNPSTTPKSIVCAKFEVSGTDFRDTGEQFNCLIIELIWLKW